MAEENPLPQLRKIGDEERRLEARLAALRAKRNRLIRKAVEDGETEGKIANAADRSPGLINHIKHRR